MNTGFVPGAVAPVQPVHRTQPAIPSVTSTLLILRCGDQPAPYVARERRHLRATPAAETPPHAVYEDSGRRLRVLLIRAPLVASTMTGTLMRQPA
jgi:hypothetical protein